MAGPGGPPRGVAALVLEGPMRFRDRLRQYLHGAASLFDPTGIVTYRATREAMPPADDRAAIKSYFDEAWKGYQ